MTTTEPRVIRVVADQSLIDALWPSRYSIPAASTVTTWRWNPWAFLGWLIIGALVWFFILGPAIRYYLAVDGKSITERDGVRIQPGFYKRNCEDRDGWVSRGTQPGELICHQNFSYEPERLVPPVPRHDRDTYWIDAGI